MNDSRQKNIEFDIAWDIAQDIMARSNIQLVVLLIYMSIHAEVTADMLNSSDLTEGMAEPHDAQDIFEHAAYIMPDDFNEEAMKAVFDNFQERMAEFSVKVGYVANMPPS